MEIRKSNQQEQSWWLRLKLDSEASTNDVKSRVIKKKQVQYPHQQTNKMRHCETQCEDEAKRAQCQCSPCRYRNGLIPLLVAQILIILAFSMSLFATLSRSMLALLLAVSTRSNAYPKILTSIMSYHPIQRPAVLVFISGKASMENVHRKAQTILKICMTCTRKFWVQIGMFPAPCPMWRASSPFYSWFGSSSSVVSLNPARFVTVWRSPSLSSWWYSHLFHLCYWTRTFATTTTVP